MKHFIIALFAVFLFGCSPGQGDARFFVLGGDDIEQQIPGADVVDGWTITFSRFLIVVGEVNLLNKELESGTVEGEPRIYDLTQPGPHLMGLAGGLKAGDWSVGFGTPKATEETQGQEFVSEFDLQLMRDAGYSLFVEGSATNGGTTKTFAWGFTDPVRYTRCGGDSGLEITNDGLTPTDLTILGDRLFRDDLVSSGSNIRFLPLSLADVDDDGQITKEELDAVPLSSISQGSYDAGDDSVTTLGAYVEAASQSLGDLTGVGRCESNVPSL